MSYVEKVQGSSINWGGVIAGAALVTGAVILAPVVMNENSIAEVFKTIGAEISKAATDFGSFIRGLFTSTTPASTEPSIFAGLGKWISDHAEALTGAALIGGGAAGLMKSSSTAYVVPNNPIPAATHVENEQMRAINGLMKARMMAANPEYMAEAMGQTR
jgi:hypothetical protein